MRNKLAIAIASCLLLCGACNQKQVEPEFQSKFIQTQNSAEFKVIADYNTLGETWQDAGGASAIKSIQTDTQSHRALFTLKGSAKQALWLDFSKGRELQKLDLKLPMLGADIEDKLVFFADGLGSEPESLLSAELPSLQPGVVWNNQLSGAKILAVASHPRARQWWFAVSTSKSAEEMEAETNSLVLYKVTPGAEQTTTNIACDNIEVDCQIVCMANGSLLLESKGFIYTATDTEAQPKKIYFAPKNRQFEVFADRAQEKLWWMYLKPVGSSAGTGRSNGTATRGKLTCFDLQGQEQASIYTGSVPFSEIVGDWTNQRCLLLQDTVGIAHADFANDSLNWPLRVRDDIPLFLLPNAGEVWAMLPDSIVGIKLDDLVKLGSKLSADKVIEGELVDELRPAALALGWKWNEVQVSPLLSQTGKLTLFDTADPDSTWSQLDWSTSKNRASSMLVVRMPTMGDEGLREMGNRGINTWCESMLITMGWPDAQLMDGSRDEYGMHFTYTLVPNARPPLTSGEFQVWITDTAAFYSLEGATFEFPDNSIEPGEARRIAAQTVADKIAVSLDTLLISSLPQAGWLAEESNGWRFLPDAQEGTSPSFRLEVLQQGKPTGLYVVYLDALSGEVLHEVEDRFSPLANLGVIGGKYSRLAAE